MASPAVLFEVAVYRVGSSSEGLRWLSVFQRLPLEWGQAEELETSKKYSAKEQSSRRPADCKVLGLEAKKWAGAVSKWIKLSQSRHGALVRKTHQKATPKDFLHFKHRRCPMPSSVIGDYETGFIQLFKGFVARCDHDAIAVWIILIEFSNVPQAWCWPATQNETIL